MLTTLHRHRAVWDRKPVLRRVYSVFFRRMLDRCSGLEPIVELGCGPGCLKDVFPEVIATDIQPTPWTDGVADATDLPFDDATVGNIVAMDVFHHISRPMSFLREATRVLRPGGRVVLLEPWTSLVGTAFYRVIHHESADSTVDPMEPFRGTKHPMDGNVALPRLVFDRGKGDAAPTSRRDSRGPAPGRARNDIPERRGACAAELPPRLRLVELRPFPALAWLFSAGFRDFSLLPTALVPVLDTVDRWLAPFASLVALRAWITLERTEKAVRPPPIPPIVHRRLEAD
jgi:SAM-dependent methyltransferase